MKISSLGAFFIGIFLASWAKYVMSSNWGRPGQHDAKIQKKLVTSGPFRFTRNPIYLGLLLVFAGFELAITSFLVILSVPLYLYMQKMIDKEEKFLEQYFQAEYLKYKYSVPKFLPKFIK